MEGGPYNLILLVQNLSKKYKNNIPLGSISCCSIILKKEHKKPSVLQLHLLLVSQSTLWPFSHKSWRHMCSAKFCDGLTPVELPGLGKISHSPSLNVKNPEFWHQLNRAFYYVCYFMALFHNKFIGKLPVSNNVIMYFYSKKLLKTW